MKINIVFPGDEDLSEEYKEKFHSLIKRIKNIIKLLIFQKLSEGILQSMALMEQLQ